MKTGRRIANPAAKQLAGTFRADRHASIVPITSSASGSTPVEPAYLSQDAKQVWQEEARRVTGCGATDADSSMFARYCEMEAAFRRMIAEGEFPKAALVTELRRTAELLGIAGAKSRLARVGAGDSRSGSPFTVRRD